MTLLSILVITINQMCYRLKGWIFCDSSTLTIRHYFILWEDIKLRLTNMLPAKIRDTPIGNGNFVLMVINSNGLGATTRIKTQDYNARTYLNNYLSCVKSKEVW